MSGIYVFARGEAIGGRIWTGLYCLAARTTTSRLQTPFILAPPPPTGYTRRGGGASITIRTAEHVRVRKPHTISAGCPKKPAKLSV